MLLLGQFGDQRGVGLDGPRHRRGGADIGRVTAVDRHLRQPRGAERRADFAALEIHQRRLERGGEDAAPIDRARTAADHGQLVDRRAAFTQRVEPEEFLGAVANLCHSGGTGAPLSGQAERMVRLLLAGLRSPAA